MDADIAIKATPIAPGKITIIIVSTEPEFTPQIRTTTLMRVMIKPTTKSFMSLPISRSSLFP